MPYFLPTNASNEQGKALKLFYFESVLMKPGLDSTSQISELWWYMENPPSTSLVHHCQTSILKSLRLTKEKWWVDKTFNYALRYESDKNDEGFHNCWLFDGIGGCSSHLLCQKKLQAYLRLLYLVEENVDCCKKMTFLDLLSDFFSIPLPCYLRRKVFRSLASFSLCVSEYPHDLPVCVAPHRS